MFFGSQNTVLPTDIVTPTLESFSENSNNIECIKGQYIFFEIVIFIRSQLRNFPPIPPRTPGHRDVCFSWRVHTSNSKKERLECEGCHPDFPDSH